MANYRFPLAATNVGGTRKEIVYYLADTDAAKPSSGLNVGDLCWAVDTGFMYVASSSTTWKTVAVAESDTTFTAPQYFNGGAYIAGATIAGLLISTGFSTTPTAVSANTTITANHHVVYAITGVGGITLTLPAASSATYGRVYYFFKVDSGVGLLTVAPNGTNTLNGVNANKTIANQWNGCRIQGVTTSGWLVTSFAGL